MCHDCEDYCKQAPPCLGSKTNTVMYTKTPDRILKNFELEWSPSRKYFMNLFYNIQKYVENKQPLRQMLQTQTCNYLKTQTNNQNFAIEYSVLHLQAINNTISKHDTRLKKCINANPPIY